MGDWTKFGVKEHKKVYDGSYVEAEGDNGVKISFGVEWDSKTEQVVLRIPHVVDKQTFGKVVVESTDDFATPMRVLKTTDPAGYRVRFTLPLEVDFEVDKDGQVAVVGLVTPGGDPWGD